MTTVSPRVQAAMSSAGKCQFGVFRRYELARMETLSMTVVYGTSELRRLHIPLHPAHPTFLVASLKFYR
jgi:hypothetical protein